MATKPRYIVINARTGETLSEPVPKPQAEDIADLLCEMENVPAKVVQHGSVRTNPTSYLQKLVDTIVGEGHLTKDGVRAAYAVRVAKTPDVLRRSVAHLIAITEPLIEQDSDDGESGFALRELSEIADNAEHRANPTASGGVLVGLGVALAGILAFFSFGGSKKPPGPVPDGKDPPGGRPPGPTPREWVDTPVVSPLTSTIVVIGDASADLLVSQMAPLLPKGKKILSLKAGTSLEQMSPEARKSLDAFLKTRILAGNPFGLSTDVFLLSHSSDTDPANLVNELRPLLTKNDPIVWVPPFGNADMLTKLQQTFAEARASGNRVVGIITTAVTDTPGWGASVLADITAVNGIPKGKRI